MDKDRVEGKVEDVKGRVKRQVGEWTGDEKAQAEGAAQQVKGKIQNAWGQAKDAGREMLDKSKKAQSDTEEQVGRNKKKDDAA
jgi:uncharacterized protein YjbJ (UPF0337 family)